MAASKMEALKRYMGGGAPEEKLKKKRKKKKTETGLGMYVVDDDDDAWNDGLSKQGKGKDLWQDERTDYDEEQPTVVGDGAEDYDPESQPIVANAEEFFERERTEELEKQWLAAETKPSVDASPPRKARHQDASPPRKSRQQDASSPPRKSRRQGVKDLSEASSPSRQKEDLSPPRKVRHEDNSPPRRRKKVASGDRPQDLSQEENSSPPRRPRDDTSPPRRSNRDISSPPHRDTSSPPRRSHRDTSSPPRRRSRFDNASPPRREKQRDDGSQRSTRDHAASPPRRSRRTDDSSPPRRSRRENSPPSSRSRRVDASPPRRSHQGKSPRQSGRDTSSPRRRSRFDVAPSSRKESSSPPRRRPHEEISPPRPRSSPPTSTSRFDPRRRDAPASPKSGRRDGNASSPRRNPSNDDQIAVGGVFTGKEFKAQQDQLRATQQAAFQDEALMGKQAETIYRDKRGRKLDMLMEMQRQQEIQDGKRKREAKEEFEWGTGKVRKEELRSHQQELDAMRAKPFARHNDDAELESLRKAKPRAFDPMESSLFKDDVDDTAKKGPKKNQKPTYAGPPAPPNRFNIPPGYRWDGVVRGNNWEEKALLQVNARKAHKQDMYQWATADM